MSAPDDWKRYLSADGVFDTKLLAADTLEAKRIGPTQRTAEAEEISRAKASSREFDERGRVAEREILAAMRKTQIS